MILLDTDHLCVLVDERSSQHANLRDCLQEAIEERITIPIISVEEQLRGWLGETHRLREFTKQVAAYERLLMLIEFLSHWELMNFDIRASIECQRLRRQRLGIGTQDLKIAAIAIVNDGTLLSANLRDFRKVPGLKVENWLE
jgi:tRNA(fMet)-specific endonuclease VapC